MTFLGCAAAQRRLQAYHDGELPVSEQIAVTSHVARCSACADSLADLETLAFAMRTVATARRGLNRDQAAAELQMPRSTLQLRLRRILAAFRRREEDR